MLTVKLHWGIPHCRDQLSKKPRWMQSMVFLAIPGVRDPNGRLIAHPSKNDSKIWPRKDAVFNWGAYQKHSFDIWESTSWFYNKRSQSIASSLLTASSHPRVPLLVFNNDHLWICPACLGLSCFPLGNSFLEACFIIWRRQILSELSSKFWLICRHFFFLSTLVNFRCIKIELGYMAWSRSRGKDYQHIRSPAARPRMADPRAWEAVWDLYIRRHFQKARCDKVGSSWLSPMSHGCKETVRENHGGGAAMGIRSEGLMSASGLGRRKDSMKSVLALPMESVV